MDRRNIWNLVKQNPQDALSQQSMSRSLFGYDVIVYTFNCHLFI